MPACGTCHVIMHSRKTMICQEIFANRRADVRCCNRDDKKSVCKALGPI